MTSLSDSKNRMKKQYTLGLYCASDISNDTSQQENKLCEKAIDV